MTRREAIEFGEERADLFGGKMEEFIKLSVEALKEQKNRKQNAINFMNELELIFSDIRERNVDDSVCGLCEYDCDHGLDGYANECPGFERDDCFKLKEEYRQKRINRILGDMCEVAE